MAVIVADLFQISWSVVNVDALRCACIILLIGCPRVLVAQIALIALLVFVLLL